MTHFSTFLQTGTAAIQQYLWATCAADEDTARKTGLMYGITLVGILFLSLLGALAFIQDNLILAALDFLAASLLFVILFLLRAKGHLYFCIYTGIALMYCLYLYLFISGGVAGTAYLWSYTFPLFTLFLLGSRKGLFISLLYFLSCLAVLVVDLNSPLINLYDKNLALRFIPSFMVVILFSLIYEKFRENSYSALLESRNTLEHKVIERTLELQQEIESRKKKEQELRLSEGRYRTLYDNSSDGISIISLDGRYLSANHQFCSRLGYSEEELKARGPEDVYSGNDEVSIMAMLKKVLSTGSAQFEAEQVCKSGVHIQVEIRARRINFANQDAILCSCRNISERKKQEAERKNLQQQLFRASKMEAIGMMAGGVAHDLNNILCGIVSYPELILLQLPPSSALRPPLEAIQASGKRAATVVADLLTVARGAASVKEPHDINLLIQEYLDSPEYQTLTSLHLGVVCAQQFDAGHPIITCSPLHIRKTVMNLMTNAMEAVGNKGTVLISTDNRQIDKTAGLKHDIIPGNYVVLTVQDNGPGISDRDREHIFEPFYTKKAMGQHSGTGLGLAIVWNTVQDHNGKIFVESNKEGTRFQLYFPVSEEDEIVHHPQDNPQKLAGNNEHILVVDDDPQLRDIASQILQNLGYRADSVCSGELAIRFVKEAPVDLMIIDMVMEPGINGRQTYEEILKLYPGQKAIIASGYSESADIKKTLELGASGLVKKPYSINELGRSVKDALGS